jgi:hypothetical protein
MNMSIKNKNLFMLALLVLAVFAALSYVSYRVYDNYPFCSDEYNYLYQAKIFASGHLWLNADKRVHDLFEIYTIFSNGKFFSKYPPGTSLLLLPGVKLGIPGLINPLISIITLIFLYLLCAEFIGSYLSVLAVSVVAINIYFLGYGASYFSQPASLCLTTMALFFFQRYRSSKRELFLILSMSALSCHFLVRSLDAFCLWAAISYGVLMSSRPKKTLLYCLLPVIGILALLSYNKVLAGHWSIAPYSVFSSDFKVIYGGHQTVRSYIAAMFPDILRNLNANLLFSFDWYFLPLILIWTPFIGLGLFGRRSDNDAFRGFGMVSLAYVLLFVVLYCFHPAGEWNRGGAPVYGARYWYPLIAPIAVLIAEGVRGFYQRLPRRSFWIILGFCLILQCAQDVHYFNHYSLRFRAVRAIRADIDSQCPPKSIIILREPNNWYNSAPDLTLWYDLQRNPFLKGARLFVFPSADLKALQKAYPGYTVRNYFFPEPYHYVNLALLRREGSYFNSILFSTPVVMFNGNTYICYLSDSGDVIVAKWTAEKKSWAKTKVGRGVTVDARDNFTLGIDSAGYIHVSLGKHGRPLKYMVSGKPEDISRFHSGKMTGVADDMVASPRFFKSPSNKLYFLYRNGSSSSSDLYIKKYDAGTGKWSDLAAPLIRGTGVSASASPYEFTIAWDPQENMHLFWNWRQNGENTRSNIFDVLYAKYDKNRSRWEKSDGTPYSLPITKGKAEIIDNIWMNLGLSDQNSVVADRNGFPHVVYEKFAPDGHSEIFHACFNGSFWRITRVTNMNQAVPLNLYDLWRPQIIIDRSNVIYVFFADAGTKISQKGPSPSGWLFDTASGDNGVTWTRPKALKVKEVGEFAYDQAYFRDTGNVRFFYQIHNEPILPLYTIELQKKPQK